MASSRLLKWTVLALLIFVAIGIFLYRNLLGPPEIVWSTEIHAGNRLVDEIEAYRRNHGQLPSDLMDIGTSPSERDRFFYGRCSQTDYMVWFGRTLGESMTYNSKSRDWNDVGNGCR